LRRGGSKGRKLAHHDHIAHMRRFIFAQIFDLHCHLLRASATS
jgi:hypothetical protein